MKEILIYCRVGNKDQVTAVEQENTEDSKQEGELNV